MKKRVAVHNGKKSQKSGKVINPKHNDTDREKNENVNPDLVKNNFYWNYYDGEYTEEQKTEKMSFEAVELLYYEKHYQPALDNQNEKYKKARQKNRIKEMTDWLNSPRYAPTETILHVGNIDTGFPDNMELKEMTDEYISFLREWSLRHNNCLHLLDYALHADEVYIDDDTNKEKLSSTHVHIRFVFDYYDKATDSLCIGIEKALEKAGIALPDPKSKASRYNNRMMKFTEECRNKWQEIAVSYGYDIETTPLPKRRAKDKPTYIAEKKAEKELANALEIQEQAKAELAKAIEMQQQNQIYSAQYEKAIEQLEKEKAEYTSKQSELSQYISVMENMQKVLNDGIQRNESLAAEIKDVKKRQEFQEKNKRNQRYVDQELNAYVASITNQQQNDSYKEL